MIYEKKADRRSSRFDFEEDPFRWIRKIEADDEINIRIHKRGIKTWRMARKIKRPSLDQVACFSSFFFLFLYRSYLSHGANEIYVII